MSKDWIGNKKSTYATLGASNHTETERQTDDFYATNPESLKVFLERLKDDGYKRRNNYGRYSII